MSAADLMPVLPEIAMLTFACAVLLASAFARDGRYRGSYLLAQAGLLVTLVLVLGTGPAGENVLFHGSVVIDPVSRVLKAFVCALVAFVFVYSRAYLSRNGMLTGEYFAIGLFAVLGMMVMISAHSFLTAYLGLELLSLSLYSMVAMHRHSATASEAAMKYFVLGALASGMLLYGMSIVYGVTGTLDLGVLSQVVREANPMLVFGLVFILVGVAFKLGVVPFHAWVPDVYQGAPTSVTMFIGTAPKLAAFALAFRLLAEALGGLGEQWQEMLVVLALLSLALGNVIAIAQTNIKRMLAYSTIAHMGFLLMGLIAYNPEGYSAAMFYAIVYAIMGMGSFGVVILLGRQGAECEQLQDYRGLSRRSPWFALMMLLLMFSMAGIPPFAGFWAKWFVLSEVIAAGYVWVAAVAVVFSIIGAFYYLRVIKLMYFDDPEDLPVPQPSGEVGLLVSVNALSVLALGLLPGALMNICLAAMGAQFP